MSLTDAPADNRGRDQHVALTAAFNSERKSFLALLLASAHRIKCTPVATPWRFEICQRQLCTHFLNAHKPFAARCGQSDSFQPGRPLFDCGMHFLRRWSRVYLQA